ncbi:MAG TPA: hypothetical protein VMT89_00455 [Candidatus Acidoferrales bacterium]|nr:hypothetical protein [Candidatus Acidoferrales bacterium]
MPPKPTDVAAVIEGAPVATFDLDIVPDRRLSNIERLVQALDELHARYRERPDLHPDAETLCGADHHLLMTRHGPLDVLGIIGRDRDFHSLMPHTRRRSAQGMIVYVLDLETQIAVKQELKFPKDRAVMPILRAALQEQRKRGRRRS